jgi:methyl-accepting chemotaxis protein
MEALHSIATQLNNMVGQLNNIHTIVKQTAVQLRHKLDESLSTLSQLDKSFKSIKSDLKDLTEDVNKIKKILQEKKES